MSPHAWAWFYANVNTLHTERTGALLRRLEAARRFLDSHLDEALPLDDAARQAHLSKFHFLRLFKAAFHETPHRYLRRRRLEAARRLLVRTELPVTVVCLQVGFESLGTFSSVFRQSFGASPNEFRRRY